MTAVQWAPLSANWNAKLTRRHWRRDGRPKIPMTREEAERAAAEMTARLPWVFNAYTCPKCGAWHAGRQPQPIYRTPETAFVELGVRVVACLRVENKGSSTARVHKIRERFDVIWRRRMSQ